MKRSRLLPLLAFAAFVGGCEPDTLTSPADFDEIGAQFATFPPASVAIIGGSTLSTGFPCGYSSTAANYMSYTWGGCLPVGIPALSGFGFTPFLSTDVTPGSLASYDIVVLNMATQDTRCSSGNLSADAKDEIISVAAAGKKVIIYDSECSESGLGLDYSWLPYPFTTANPGALGQTGTLTIVEENTLSTNGPGAYYIDAVVLGSQTDAVGDMNVMTTQDPAWCVDMAGTNALGVTGAVHTYANFPSGTDHGLFIYNGLDVDYLTVDYPGSQELLKVWVNELLQPVAPSDLPCRIPVVNIQLDPDEAVNHVGEEHTVTATVADLLSNPQPDVLVNFTVVSGPNAGVAGPEMTDENGQASFTYAGLGGVGVDEIQACFTDTDGVVKCSALVTKTWVNVPPICGPVEVDLGVVLLGTAVTASGSFTDLADPGDHWAAWHWGDGTMSEGTVDQVAHTVGPDSHVYEATGSYILELEVVDAAGDACGTRWGRVRVFDPDAGFVTGGGWIDSPAGAYRPDGTVEGRATFGFVAKYKRGDMVPTGNVEFQLHDADLNFHSTDLLWLLVTEEGTSFILRAQGTVNGELSPEGYPYEIMIRGEEGRPDTVRFWMYEYNGPGMGSSIYYTGFAQIPLGGGSFQIHTKGK